MTSKPVNLSPIRIYILWHPGFDLPEKLADRDPATFSESEITRVDRGLKLARRIYHWFRMDSMEGIPVYFRNMPQPGRDMPIPVSQEPDVRNYIIPLVEANMVTSPEWRRYMSGLACRDDDASKNSDAVCGEKDCRLFPVAMDSVAYNMPREMRQINFIRHIQDTDSPPDDGQLLAKLTEVICRDLRYWLMRNPMLKSGTHAPAVPGKIRIFLSHAKADETKETQTIKEYIQRNTQCEAFFDETDIASGYNYANILTNAVTHESAGLIVLQGDNYADRPWCRKEIRDFLNPVKDPLATKRGPLTQFFIPPVVVVQTMKGKQLARTIPELGYSPCLRWQDQSAGFVVTTLLREILLGLFYRVLADRSAEARLEPGEIFINRAPDPVMVNRILKARLADGPSPVLTIVHPGYGLSRLEMEGLECASSGIKFRSFLEHTRSGGGLPSNPDANRDGSETSLPPLIGKVITLSAGTPGDILATGQSDEHIAELLTRLLRPLITAGASMLYGGTLSGSFRPEMPWNDSLNFTSLLLSLILSERETAGKEASNDFPRLILPLRWHERDTISRHDIAQWLDICSIMHPPETEAGINSDELPPPPADPTAADMEHLSDPEKRQHLADHRNLATAYQNTMAAVTAVSLTAMRRRTCAASLEIHLPDAPQEVNARMDSIAHIFIGGKMVDFHGIMPGLFEEMLCALQAKKPVFLIAACGGAAAVIRDHLLALAGRGASKPVPDVPPVFTARHYARHKKFDQMLEGIKHRAITCNPNDSFNDLWSELCRVHDAKSLNALLNNGLEGDDNITLLNAKSFLTISELVWKGIARCVTV